MKLVFVAGPYRGKTPWDVEQHVRMAEEHALAIWDLGAVAVCPHSMNRFFQTRVPDSPAMAGALELLRRCDAVYMVPGYHQSVGALAELEEAVRLKIPVFEELDALAAWVDKESHGTE